MSSTAVLDKPAAVATNAASGEERQVVALHLGDEMYGIDIAQVHTVITPQAITHVPKSPPFVQGVINLRGRIIPVVDLRARFGMPPLPEERQSHARIVIVNDAAQDLSAGLIVDAVSEVLRLPAESIDPPSRLVASAEAGDCITGIGRIGGRRETDSDPTRLIILLDVCKTLTNNADEVGALQSLTSVAA